MAKVAQQVVQSNGIDTEKLVRQLIRAASAEFTIYYYYTLVRVNAIGFVSVCTDDVLIKF